MNSIKLQLSLLFIFCFQLQIIAQIEKSKESSCELKDSEQIIIHNEKTKTCVITEELIPGINNGKLDAGASLNGKTDIEQTLAAVLKENLGEEKFNSDQYKVLDMSFVINPDNSISNLFFTHELFWFLEEDGKTQFAEMMANASKAEIEMSKSMLGFMEYEEIYALKKIIKNQEWNAGSCDGSIVPTIISLELNKPQVKY